MSTPLNEQGRRAAATRRRQRRDGEATIEQYVRGLAVRRRTSPAASTRSPNVKDMHRSCMWQKQSRED
jgi:hypothetical protein